ISMRRGSKPHWWAISAIAARRCCSRPCCPCDRPPASRHSSSAPSISAAAPFTRTVDHFIGVDLSPRMIERARATSLYAELEVADMSQGLRARPDASADLILAADAIVYVADLPPVLAEASRVLASGGLLAFTAETHGGEGVVIGQGLRYAHSAAYVRDAVHGAGLELALLENHSARNEDHAPVPGLVAVAAKT